MYFSYIYFDISLKSKNALLRIIHEIITKKSAVPDVLVIQTIVYMQYLFS